MRIGLVCTEFQKRGGTSRYTVELAERFCKKHEVHLITRRYEYKIPDLIVHEYPQQRGPLAAQIFADALYATNCLKKIEKSLDLDIIHSAAANIVADVTTAHSCHKASIKIWNAASRGEYSFPRYLFYKIARELLPANRVILALEKQGLQKSGKIISVSEWTKQEIITNYDVPKEKIVVIPNGVNLKDFKPDKGQRLEIRQKYGIDENEVVLIFVAHEFKRKGLAHLIRALPHVEAKLFVIGKDNPSPYRLLARNFDVNDKIIFTGVVSNVEDYYAASDIFVFPTTDEPFGLVITEAMASEVPPITSKLAGAVSIMKDGHDCLLLNDPTDSKEIAEKINLLVDDENLRKRMGKNARKTVKNYSWDKIAKKTIEVYKKFLD